MNEWLTTVGLFEIAMLAVVTGVTAGYLVTMVIKVLILSMLDDSEE